MKTYTDLMLKTDLWPLIHAENMIQLQKWGVQSRTAFEWVTYLTEEVGELAKAVSEHEYRQGSVNRVVLEAVQVSTLALKIAEMFSRRCRVCGCTNYDCSGCLEKDGEPCHWVELDLCSSCAEKEGEKDADI